MPKIQAVLLGSEACLPAQRQRISTAFSSRVFSWYGHSERLILGGECEFDCSYHHFPDYGILEIVDELRGVEVAEGERGELVGTGLLNRCLPLIRYRTGDYARRLPPQCNCHRCWNRFDQVEGHWKQEMVVGRSGARISLAALNMHGPIFEHVLRYQYYQCTPGDCELRVLVAEGFTDADRRAIESAYATKVGDELRLRLVTVPDIPLTSRGKLRMLVSDLRQSNDGADATADRGHMQDGLHQV